MKRQPNPKALALRPRALAAAIALCACAALTVRAQTIQWGLTLTNINNPIPPIVITNTAGNTNGPGGTQAPVGSLTIIAGGGDAYNNPDSFTYAYQQITGDFDMRVRIINNDPTDPQVQDSPRGELMVRTTLDPIAYDYQIDGEPPAPSGRDGQICSIARIILNAGTDDIPGRGAVYGGDTTSTLYASFPDLWIRIQRQGDKFMAYYATTNTTDYPSGTALNPAVPTVGSFLR